MGTMKRGNQIQALIAAVIAAGFVLMIPAVSHAGASQSQALSPEWSRKSSCQNDVNSTFFAQIQGGRLAGDQPLMDQILDPKLAIQMKQEYQDMNRDYDFREKYDLVSMEEKKAQASRLSGFTSNIVNTIKNYHVHKNLDQARANVEKDPDFGVLKTPMAVMAAMVGFYYGAPVKFKTSKTTQFKFRAEVPTQKADLEMQSKVVNGSVNFAGASPKEDPLHMRKMDTTQSAERYQVRLSRGIPFLGIGSGVGYAGTSQTVSASLSKQIVDNLSAEVSTSHKVSDSNAGSPGQEAVRLNYGFSF